MKRLINVLGFDVELHDFGYASYLYPAFNGDAEFSATKKGFKQLSHYLRIVRWAINLRQDLICKENNG